MTDPLDSSFLWHVGIPMEVFDLKLDNDVTSLIKRRLRQQFDVDSDEPLPQELSRMVDALQSKLNMLSSLCAQPKTNQSA